MAKPGPLSKADKYYIDENWTTKSAGVISAFLNRSPETVQTYIDHVKVMKTKAGGQFARYGDPEKGGAVVATEAATMRGDDFKKDKSTSRRQKRCTVKITDL